MLLIIGAVRLPAQNLTVARPVMRRMVDASLAEEGCVESSYAEDVFDPGLIHVEARRIDYNLQRPHTSLGGLIPNEFATRSRQDQNQSGLWS